MRSNSHPCRSAARSAATAQRHGPGRPGMICAILAVDIAAFGDPARDNDVQRFVHDALYRLVAEAFNRCGVPWHGCYHEDRGDGIVIIIPAATDAAAIASLPAWLHAEIQRHNKCASPAARIQLRAALHIGPVQRDDHGLSGAELIRTARMLDAQQLRDALAGSHSALAFAVSAFVYDSIIRHSPGLADPSAFRQIDVRVKESSFPAWLMVTPTPQLQLAELTLDTGNHVMNGATP